MVIYGEYLFIENFIAGLLLILLTGKLTGRMPAKMRILLAAVLCGLSGFIIFLPLNGGWSAVLRLLAGTLCAAAAFGLREIVKTTGLFLALTFLSGGAVMALLLWRQQPAVSHQGIIYMDAVTYFRLLCFGILAFGLTYWFVKLVRRRKAEMNMKGRVCLIIDGKSYFFEAFVDSGNCLREPVTGKPVVLLDNRGASRLPFGAKDMPSRYRIIPYHGVGVEAGSLEALRTDEIIFEDHKTEGAYIAFYKGRFEGFEVLMNRDFLEGGLLKHV